MIKKIIVIGLIITLAVVFVGCDSLNTTTLTTTSPTNITNTTTSATPLTDLIPEECTSIDITDGWVPVWCDEFNYTGGVDTTKWSVVTGGGGFGNQEAQYYTNRTENLYVDGENLKITALKESYGSSQYTSAKIWTVNTESWKYGKFEMRAKIPFGRGTWPAFWMMPQTSRYGGWPNSGEIDIMEHVGYDLNNILGTIHTERFNGSNGRGGSASILETQGLVPTIDVVNEFHTYGIIWDETSIRWYFDGYQYASVGYNTNLAGTVLYDTTVDWPFDQRFYLILNLAIGGTWGGAQGIDDTIFPTTYTIDYVRVFQQDYESQDTQSPTTPTNPRVLRKSEGTAYLTWQASTDDMKVARYYVYVNGILQDKTPVNGILLTGLTLDSDNMIIIIAEDYVGNLSDALETIITT